METKKLLVWSLVSLSTLIVGSCSNGKLSQSERESLSHALEKYDEFSNFSEGLAKVSKDGKLGFIDKTGKEVIPCIYSFIYENYHPLYEGFAVRIDDKNTGAVNMGFIDKMGKEIVPCTYDLVMKNEDFGVDDLILIFVIKHSEDERAFYGAFDKNGKEVIPCIYSSPELQQKIDEVRKEGKYNSDKIKFKYTFKDYSSNGFASLNKEGKYDFNKEAESGGSPWNFNNFSKGIENVYFSEGLAKVNWNNRDGFIDTEGYFIGKGIVENVFASEKAGKETILPKANDFYENEETSEVPQEIEKTYKHINVKRYFEGTIYSEQRYLSLIKTYQRLTFHPINEYEGNVLIETLYEEASAATAGGVKREQNTVSYYISEDGKIIIGSTILERSGRNDLKSNLTDNRGYTITFYLK